jgi:hypothetical protein
MAAEAGRNDAGNKVKLDGGRGKNGGGAGTKCCK